MAKKQKEGNAAVRKRLRRKHTKGWRVWKVILVLLAVLLLAGGITFWMLDIEVVTVGGNQYYTAEEIENRLFENPLEKRTIYAWFANRFGEKKVIPFVQSYQIEITGLHSVEVMIYEKSYVGCVSYLGSYLYFDKDGIVVDSSSKILEGVPVIEGLDFNQIVLYQPLPVENDTIFTDIMNLTQQLGKYGIVADRIQYNHTEVTITVGDVRVKLGSRKYLEEKVAELYSMQEQLKGCKGTLYLNDYDPTNKDKGFSFIHD